MENEIVDIPQLFDYRAAAEVLHLSHFTLRRWISEKRLEHVKLGGRVFFTKSQLAQIITSRSVEPVLGK
ncbi:MAG: helix-turn-helix domain-containing protein [Planctomycetes bacterium]|nr:helix-turn-helix domain-containing protein [Planctomycetota bacterium]